jgi:hypothetical protein
MSKASGNRFIVEGLENRTLLSASVVADLLASSLDVGIRAHQTAALSGSSAQTASPAATASVMRKHVVPATTPLTGAFNIAGTFTHAVGPGFNPDAGNLYHFTGSGKKRSLGTFTMEGDVHGIGFIASGRFRGYVTLTSSQGTIDVRLLGPEQAPGAFPDTLAFKIVNGTGVYANASGKGAIAVSASDDTQKFVFRANQG